MLYPPFTVGANTMGAHTMGDHTTTATTTTTICAAKQWLVFPHPSMPTHCMFTHRTVLCHATMCA